MNVAFLHIIKSPATAVLLFLAVLLYYSADMQLVSQMEMPPAGIHQWRQTDGASMARLYHQEKVPFLEPKIYNQLADDGSAGGEFPILYYATAKLYDLFGFDHTFMRKLHFLLFCLGALTFVFFAVRWVEPAVFSLFPVIFMLSSPTLIYYAVNYLPDAPALGLSMAATGIILDHMMRKPSRTKQWTAAMLFILAGLIKISMVLPFAALMAFALYSLLRNGRSPAYSWHSVTVMSVAVCIPILVWYVYVAQYNAAHGSHYFATGIIPFWEASPEQVTRINERITGQWIPLIFPSWLRYTFIVATIVAIVCRKKIHPALGGVALLACFGALAYLGLFYINLFDHDYYFLPLFFPILLVIMAAVQGLVLSVSKFTLRIALLAVFTVVGWNAMGSAVKLNKKSYRGWFTDFSNSKSFVTMEAFLDRHGIGPETKVFVPLDFSSNQVLYFLNRKGWTQLTGNYDSDELDLLIERGAEYVIVSDTSFYSITYLQYHITDTIGYHNEIGVYKIGHSKWWKPEGSL